MSIIEHEKKLKHGLEAKSKHLSLCDRNPVETTTLFILREKYF